MVSGWIRRGGFNSSKPVENRELMGRTYILKNRHENIVFEHVRGIRTTKVITEQDYLVNLAMDEYLESHKNTPYNETIKILF